MTELEKRRNGETKAHAGGAALPWDGERFIPGMPASIELEHVHRYRLAAQLAKGLRVLDVASGEGYGTAMIAAAAEHAIGVDISEDAVVHARSTHRAANLEYRVGSAAALPVDSASIDLVASFETIEHHDQHEEMMREIKRVLKPGGVLLISSPNKLEYSDAREFENEFHVKELYLEEFRDLLKRHFANLEIHGQRVLTGSVLTPLMPSARGFMNLDATDHPSVSRPLYFIAVASDGDVPKLDVSIFEIERGSDGDTFSDLGAGKLTFKSYWRGAGVDYDEGRPPSRSPTFGARRALIDLVFQRIDREVTGVRIDPGDRAIAIVLHELSLLDAEGQIAWRWNGDTAALLRPQHLRLLRLRDGGDLYVVTTGPDPWFELDLPSDIMRRVGDGWALRLCVSTLGDNDVASEFALLLQTEPYAGKLRQRAELLEQKLTELNIRFEAQQNAVTRASVMLEAQGDSLARLTAVGESHVKRQLELEAELEGKNAELQALRASYDQTRHDLLMATESTSWKVTRPLRAVRNAALDARGVVDRARHALKDKGVLGLLRRAPEPAPPRDLYGEWYQRYDTLDDAKRAEIRLLIASLSRKPLISVVVPTYDTPEPYLRAMIESVRAQLYPSWELCIADDASPNPAVKRVLQEYAAKDARIKVRLREINGHISEASNSALELATGDFVALLDHDDILPEHALFMVARYIERHPDARLFFSDEDKLTPEGKRTFPYFKSDWNPELMLAQNMFSHLGVYQTGLIRAVGGFRAGFEGSQDHDLILRCVERAGDAAVVHIPHILYHWRIVPGSTSGQIAEKPYTVLATVRTVQEHLDRMGVAAVLSRPIADSNMLRVRYALQAQPPLVSIIIPTRDHAKLLQKCIDSVLSKTSYANYEILIVDNGSRERETLEYLKFLSQWRNIRVIRDDRPFNFSALNNLAVAQAKGEYLCLLNNDTEVITVDWLDEMLSHAVRPRSGAVGAALWYPNATLQHGGVMVGIGDLAGHMHHLMPLGQFGYFARAALTQNVTAVTAACMVVRKSIYQEVGGFNEELAVAFNDVDFCLRVQRAGYRNIYTPYAHLLHDASKSRGIDHTPDKRARLRSEVACMRQTWGQQVVLDPFYNPNLSVAEGEQFLPAFPPRIGQFD